MVMSMQYVDKEGKTPLIVACMNLTLYNVAKTLIELGANINAYRPGMINGLPFWLIFLVYFIPPFPLREMRHYCCMYSLIVCKI